MTNFPPNKMKNKNDKYSATNNSPNKRNVNSTTTANGNKFYDTNKESDSTNGTNIHDLKQKTFEEIRIKTIGR